MYYLYWTHQYGSEIIEDEIETQEEAEYLQGEYTIAYGGVVEIRKH